MTFWETGHSCFFFFFFFFFFFCVCVCVCVCHFYKGGNIYAVLVAFLQSNCFVKWLYSTFTFNHACLLQHHVHTHGRVNPESAKQNGNRRHSVVSYYYFSEKIRLVFSCESSAMKRRLIFSEKKKYKKENVDCCSCDQPFKGWLCHCQKCKWKYSGNATIHVISKICFGLFGYNISLCVGVIIMHSISAKIQSAR